MNTLRILLICLLPLASMAQSPVSTRLSSGLDLGAGFRKDQVSPSLSYYQLLSVTKSKFLSVGWQTTFRTFYASNVDYITAPADLSRGGKTGFYALGAPLVPARLDTLSMSSASGTSLNLGVRAEIHLKFVDIGASADILGITIGRKRIGQYRSSTGSFIGKTSAGVDSTQRFTGSNVNQSARPTIANLQLLGDNAIGTLATEVYARALVGQRVGIKVGYQWLTTEYTASVKNVLDDNNRFRSHSGLTYVAVTIPFFR
ncbi:hypothetical protein [Fibrivirga algicola]|uniref:Uncharacterized protein n=1 Tax=Fibrivirga algicola TaxID=2950420 RepID=A0ABX0QF43_9BACT|nr:hypothetical protein [Fibrivirga algicola]NID11036.1 hypothetical protein [Fibrivirga algicola]